MSDTLTIGLDYIMYMQQFRSPFMDILIRTITLLGEEEFYLLTLPLIFWCVDYRVGVRLTYFVLLSHYLNICIKDLLQEPRPFYFRPEVKLFHADGYSLPSNHAQTGLIYWLGLARFINNKWLWSIGFILTILIGLSRIYLGVHFPTDVFAGWGLGAVLLLLFINLDTLDSIRIGQFSTFVQAVLALIIPLLLWAVHPNKDTAAVIGGLSGAFFGQVFQRVYLPSANKVPKGDIKMLAIRATVGICILIAVWLGLKMVLPQEGTEYYLAGRYSRYWFTCLWVTLGAPYLFIHLKLDSSAKTINIRGQAL